MNRTQGISRERGQRGDRRVRRTRWALSTALVKLMRGKSYRAITIQNILDLADVGRSTFYSHYRGKDDLLLRSFEELLEMLDAGMTRSPTDAHRVAPVRELFRHVGESRRFHQALNRAHILDRMYNAGANRLSQTIEARLSHPSDSLSTLPAPVLARSLAGAVFALLGWWLENETKYSPSEMDQMFHGIHRPLPRSTPVPSES